MPTYDSFEEPRIKHLEMVQAVIARLGNDSFLVKGWAITVAGVFFGFAVSQSNPALALASVLPTLCFWGVDAYFLRSERLFRALYDDVRAGGCDDRPFFMGATSPDFVEAATKTARRGRCWRKPYGWWRTAWRPTLCVFYLALLLSAGLVVALTAAHENGRDSAQPCEQTLRIRDARSLFDCRLAARSGGQIRPKPSSLQRGTR